MLLRGDVTIQAPDKRDWDFLAVLYQAVGTRGKKWTHIQ